MNTLTEIRNKLTLCASSPKDNAVFESSSKSNENLFFELSEANPDILLGPENLNMRRLLAELATKSLNVGIVRYILGTIGEGEHWTRNYNCWVNVLYWAATMSSRELMIIALIEIENENFQEEDEQIGYHGALDLAITNNDTKSLKAIMRLVSESTYENC